MDTGCAGRGGDDASKPAPATTAGKPPRDRDKHDLRFNGTANIDIRHHTEVGGAVGDEQLQALVLRDNTTGMTESVSAAAFFVLIGAEPHTDWLPVGVQRDSHGFLLTGSDLGRCDPPDGWPLPRSPFPLETSLPGVFAAGDVRQRSVKRVASAVGEGSIAATQVSQYLQQPSQPVR